MVVVCVSEPALKEVKEMPACETARASEAGAAPAPPLAPPRRLTIAEAIQAQKMAAAAKPVTASRPAALGKAAARKSTTKPARAHRHRSYDYDEYPDDSDDGRVYSIRHDDEGYAHQCYYDGGWCKSDGSKLM